MSEPAAQKKSVFRRAFANQYNLILLGAAGLFGLATFSWVPLIVGAGVEALWLVLGADSQAFRRWAALQEGKEAQERAQQEISEALAALPAAHQQRHAELADLAGRIQTLARQNTTFAGGLVEQETDKMGRALHSFVTMAVSHVRLGRYLAENEAGEIERDIARCQRDLTRERDRDVQASLRQVEALAQKRLEQHRRIEASYKVLSLKMEALEKSLCYLESRIVAMDKREELMSELDEMVVGVESVEQFTLETDGLLSGLDAAAARTDAAAARSAGKRAQQGQRLKS